MCSKNPVPKSYTIILRIGFTCFLLKSRFLTHIPEISFCFIKYMYVYNPRLSRVFKFKYFAITKPNALDNVFWWCPCVKTCFLNYICPFKSFVSIFLLRICKRFFEGFTPPCDTSQIGHFQLSLKLNVRIRVSNVSVFQLIHLLEAKSEVTLRSPSFRFNQASIIILTNYSVAIPQLTNPKLFPLVTQILHSEPIVIYKWNPISTGGRFFQYLPKNR